ncbi:serine protease [Vibrio sp. Of14-4]|uniref:serine protease n=1 Tax=Vibrio sp. Of14-4 TaxID=2724878 RepID=UPI001EF1FCA9|nr:serine protease [Vibrio sp. Of14-4]MCG7490709.1 serine protease [Vibrio sp. Of14-4]
MNLCGNLVYSILRLCTLLLLAMLAGCTGNNGQLKVVKQHPDLDYELTGIPLLFFGFGTSTPITPELSLTVAHVAKLNYDKVIAYHPHCDLAIVESRNMLNHQPRFGLVYPNQSVETFGMSPGGSVLKGEGVYRLDLTLIDSHYFDKCPASIMDAPVQDGMSGGGVYNQDGALVGIIAARAIPSDIQLVNGQPHGLDRISIFVALNFARDWLDSEMEKYYGEHYVAMEWQEPSDTLLVKGN